MSQQFLSVSSTALTFNQLLSCALYDMIAVLTSRRERIRERESERENVLAFF